MNDVLTYISLSLSTLSIYVAIRVAWDTRFKPSKLVALFSRFSVWERVGETESPNKTRVVLPSFWIRNLGAKPAIISSLQLRLICGGQTILARPEAKFSVAKIFEDTSVTFFEKSQKSFPIALDSLFTGFSLLSGETWEANYSFLIKNEDYRWLQGKVQLQIQILLYRSRRWKTIESTIIDFKTLSENGISEKGYSCIMFYPETESEDK